MLKAHYLFLAVVVAFVLGAVFPAPVDYVRSKVGV